MRKRQLLTAMITSLIAFSTLTIHSGTYEPSATIAQLDYLAYSGTIGHDYGVFIANFLAKLGIEVNLILVEPDPIISLPPIPSGFEYDMAFVTYHMGNEDPSVISSMYKEKSSMNIFGINKEIPYCNESENMIDEGVKIMDLEERQQHYYNWQQLMMDKIIPMIPLYSPRNYSGTWSNLQGYDNRWGLVESLPYMSWEGLHTGQKSTNEFITHEAQWTELNPIFSLDPSSSFIQSFIYEPILKMSPEFEPFKTGLIHGWEWIDDNRIRFTIRDDMYWNPSYDLTGRNATSGSLSEATLMVGLKGEVSNGTNQLVTTKDVLFTLYALTAPFSVHNQRFDWLRNIYAEDDYNFVITIDGEPTTEELVPYAPFWKHLNYSLLPEFFLNSTDTTTMTSKNGHLQFIGVDDVTDTEQWQNFSSMAFGTGKYMLDWAIPTSQTELVASPYWFGIGAIDGQPQTLDIENIIVRFIDNYTTALNEFKAGKLDIMYFNYWPIQNTMHPDPDFEYHSRLSIAYSSIVFNISREFIGGSNNYEWVTAEGKEEYTKGIAIRKAISYAIDKVEMNNVLHDGTFIIGDSPIFPIQYYWYNNDIIKYYYNLEKAKEWLQAAGYGSEDDGPNGWTLNLTTDVVFFTILVVLPLLNMLGKKAKSNRR